MADEQDVDNKVYEKEVTVVAYDDDLEFPGLREWAEEITGVDLTTLDTITQEWYNLVYDLGMGEQTKSIQDYDYSKDRVEEVKEQLKEAGVDSIRLEHHTEEEKKFANSLGKAARRYRTELAGELPDELFGGLELQSSWGYWYSENDPDFHVKLAHKTFDEMRVLAKESERDSDDLYETMSEVPAFKLRVDMRAPSEKHIEEWTQQVVKNLHKLLAKNPGIGKVRYMACETATIESGECYNI